MLVSHLHERVDEMSPLPTKILIETQQRILSLYRTSMKDLMELERNQVFSEFPNKEIEKKHQGRLCIGIEVRQRRGKSGREEGAQAAVDRRISWTYTRWMGWHRVLPLRPSECLCWLPWAEGGSFGECHEGFDFKDCWPHPSREEAWKWFMKLGPSSLDTLNTAWSREMVEAADSMQTNVFSTLCTYAWVFSKHMFNRWHPKLVAEFFAIQKSKLKAAPHLPPSRGSTGCMGPGAWLEKICV